MSDNEELGCSTSLKNGIEVAPIEEADDIAVGINHQERRRKLILGLFIVFGIAVSQCGQIQFAKSTYQDGFFAPYFVQWFSTNWLILSFPLLLSGSLLRSCASHESRDELLSVIRSSTDIYGSGLRQKSIRMIFVSISFTIFLLLANYLYVRALSVISPAEAQAVFSSNSAFVFVLSVLILKDTFITLKIFSVLLAVIRIVLMAYADGFQGPSAIGILLIIASSFSSALYTVYLKKFLGNNATVTQVGFFLSMIGFTNIVIFSLLVPVMCYIEENIYISNTPWDYICGSAALGLIFNFLINFGVCVTFPLFISIGMVLGIPLNALIDTLVRDLPFGPYKILGALTLILSFIVVAFVPESYDNKIQAYIQTKSKSEDPSFVDYELPRNELSTKFSKSQLLEAQEDNSAV